MKIPEKLNNLFYFVWKQDTLQDKDHHQKQLGSVSDT